MKLGTTFLRSLFLSTLAVGLLPRLSSAQVSESLLPNSHADGTVWAQCLLPKQSSGSAELGSIDFGPPVGLGISGFQGAWLEWNPTNLYVGLVGGGTASQEVTVPPGTGGASIALCMGAATLHGGWEVTTTPFGEITSVVAAQGSFFWTPSKLYVFALGGGGAVAEVTAPGGASIANVQGVSVIESFIRDYDPDLTVAAPGIRGWALVYTPTHVYHVKVLLSGGISFTTAEVFQPTGGPITSTRGITAVAGDPDFSTDPPTDALGAAFIWNPGRVYLLTQTPSLSIVEITAPGGAALAGCWSVMRMGRGSTQPTLRCLAQVWQPGSAWIVAVEPLIGVAPLTLPPGIGVEPPFVTNVTVPGAAGSPLIERQAGFLYEIMGAMLVGGSPRRALIVG